VPGEDIFNAPIRAVCTDLRGPADVNRHPGGSELGLIIGIRKCVVFSCGLVETLCMVAYMP
jgi:hypothetical protein